MPVPRAPRGLAPSAPAEGGGRVRAAGSAPGTSGLLSLSWRPRAFPNEARPWAAHDTRTTSTEAKDNLLIEPNRFLPDN